MNCKPGEMAIVTKGSGWFSRLLLGRVVTVTTYEMHDGMPSWTIQQPIQLRHKGRNYKVIGIEDHLLTPIRGLPVNEELHDEVTV